MDDEYSNEEKLDLVFSLEEKRSLSKNDWSNIQKFVNDKDSEVRYEAASLLALFPSEMSERLLISMLNDDDHLVRVAVCDSLSFSKSSDTLNLLVKAEKDKRFLVRGYAILSIGDIQKNIESDPTEIINLLKYLNDKETCEWVKIAISRSLYILGEVSYENYLLEKLNSRSYKNRCFVLSLLEELIDDNVINKNIILSHLNQRLEIENALSVKTKLQRLINKITGIKP